MVEAEAIGFVFAKVGLGARGREIAVFGFERAFCSASLLRSDFYFLY